MQENVSTNFSQEEYLATTLWALGLPYERDFYDQIIYYIIS